MSRPWLRLLAPLVRGLGGVPAEERKTLLRGCSIYGREYPPLRTSYYARQSPYALVSTGLGLLGVTAAGAPLDRSVLVRAGTAEKGYSIDRLSLPLRRRRARYATTAPMSRSFFLDTLRPEDRLSSEVSVSDSVSSW